MPRKLQVGYYLEEVGDIQNFLKDTREAGFDFICTGLVSKGYQQNELKGLGNNSQEPFSWFDMALSSADWTTSVVGVLSDAQNHMESTDNQLRIRATKLIEREVSYVQHLGLNAAIVRLNPKESSNLTRLLNSKISAEGGNHSSMVLWVCMPMTYQVESEMINGNLSTDENSGFSSWNTWNQFRTAGNSDRKTYPILELPKDLPDYDEISRWLGEPVKAIIISEDCFITNPNGFPILPKYTKRVVKAFFDIGSQIIFKGGPGRDPHAYSSHKQYVEFLHRNVRQAWEEDPVKKFTKGYEDFLQSPLQPLMDNLEATTYEVFERDPTKYVLYRDAVSEALVAKIPEAEIDTKTLIVMVVGAGRGPLIKSCIEAAESVNRKIKLFAVEKNVNAVCTLLHLKKYIWHDQVTVISSDMREWEPEEKADILVSELLGSFGDNELSPECLDGAQRILKDDGVMIPQSYTSFVSPIMCPKVHGEVRGFQDSNKYMVSHYETPYVVYLKNFYEIDKPKPLFEFVHPKPDVNESNDRYGSLEFVASMDCTMHGFAGYFDSKLYGDVRMSIHPDNYSEGMFSWFPIYFPIRDPIQIKKDDKIKVNFWRCSNKHNVWYEWSVSLPVPNPIHNVNGRSYTIGL